MAMNTGATGCGILLSDDCRPQDADILQWPLILVGCYQLNAADDIHAVDDLTIDGVEAIETGDAADGAVGCTLLRSQLYLPFSTVVEERLYAVQLGIGIALVTADDVEL